MQKKNEDVVTGRRGPGVARKGLLTAALGLQMFLGGRAAFAQATLPTTWRYDALQGVQAAVYTPDGQKLIVSGNEGVQILNAKTSAPIRCLPMDGNSQWALAVTPDGKTLVTASGFSATGSVLETWNLSTGKRIAVLPTTAKVAVTSVAVSPDGKTLVDGAITYNSFSHTRQGVIEEWDLSTGKLTKTLPTNSQQIQSIAFSGDGSSLVSLGVAYQANSAIVEVWSMATQNLVSSFISSDEYPNAIALTPDGKTLAIGGYGQGSRDGLAVLELWNVTTGNLISQLSAPGTSIQSVQFSPDGKMLVDAGVSSDVEVRDVSGAVTTTFQPGATINRIAFHPDGKSVLVFASGFFTSAGPAGLCQQYSVPKGVLIRVVDPAAYVTLSAAFSPDGKRVVTGGFSAPFGTGAYNGAVTFWNPLTGAQTETPASSLTSGINSVAISADGTLVVDGGSMLDSMMTTLVGAAEIRNGVTGEILKTLPSAARNGAAVQVAISPDAKTVAIGSSKFDNTPNSGVLELWNVSTGKLIVSLSTKILYVRGIAFSPDGKTLAAIGSSGSAASILELWTVSSRKLAKTFADASSVNLTCLAFSPDGKRIVEGGNGTTGVVDIWDIASGKSSGNICPASSANVCSLAYSPDGKSVLAETSTMVEAFSTSTLSLIGSYSTRQIFGFNGVVAISPNGLQIACASRSLLAAPNPFAGTVAVSKVTVSPASVLGGVSATGTLKLARGAPDGGSYVSLSSSNPNVSVPDFVLVPAGAATVTFPINTVTMAADASVTISATSDGVTVTSTLTVTAPVPATLTLSPAVLYGGSHSTGTITLNGPAGPGGVTVTLTSDVASVKVPASIKIAAVAKSGTFKISTQPLAVSSGAAIVATVGTHIAANSLTVLAPVVKSIGVNPRKVSGGASALGTATLGSPAPVQGMVVVLFSSDPAIASIPATVFVPAGATSVTFPVTTTKPAKATTITLTANLSGSKTITLSVTP